MKIMDPSELKQRLTRNEVSLIDVREPAEYHQAYIEGAHLIPLGQISPERLPSRLGPIVIHCGAGGRSAKACQQLLAVEPHLDIYNLAGGILAWQAAGYDVKSS